MWYLFCMMYSYVGIGISSFLKCAVFNFNESSNEKYNEVSYDFLSLAIALKFIVFLFIYRLINVLCPYLYVWKCVFMSLRNIFIIMVLCANNIVVIVEKWSFTLKGIFSSSFSLSISIRLLLFFSLHFILKSI